MPGKSAAVCFDAEIFGSEQAAGLCPRKNAERMMVMSKISGKVLAAAALLAAHTLTVGNASADSVKFILREYNGKVALFLENEEEPIAVYKTPVETFYPADKALLQKGICLGSREELVSLIDDLELR